ncbi:OmpP1/FadL family transporter [Endozoicomonas sp. SCSIO W0465]|uniref:OmpP1/FadL family transporter n=1 Tax=Endozoicomonas sp. SCSIO W0465 TaxID=2918516 RepID=UPI002074E5D8|nr:outer membrane protein transport protein [Endozoicomonas sp. SCSIO W0465]USE36540.1 outer membrane protein transport protein [Endozoicomonas sp. SCSIO W0465]
MSSLAVAVFTGNAVAGGFEKATMWDAKYAALAGAAVSSVNTSSAVFYNPAGLARIESNDIALSVSPTFVQTNGPTTGDDTYMKGETNFVPNAGLTGAYRLNDRLVMGYGFYGAGGSSTSYEGVTVGSVVPVVGDLRMTGEYSTDIKIMEAGLALAYQINDNWSIGGTYRLTYAQADINLAAASGPAGALVGYNDLSGFNTFGVRLGAMYRSDDNRWGWGLNYRSDVSIEADGKAKFESPISSYAGVDATAETALPTQISTGVDYSLNDDWKLFGEVTWTQYSSIESIKFTSNERDLAVDEIIANWDDQWNFRFATEYTGIENWALRAGYIYTTAVTPEEYAAPTFSTPAGAHSFTMGAGTTLMGGKLGLDLGAEYNFAENDSVKGGGTVTNTGTKASSGKYDTNAWALHATLRYKF